MANTMAHNVTHDARPLLHVTYLHWYYPIITARKHKTTKTMITPILKYISLVRRHPLDWDQPKHVTLSNPKMELDSLPDAMWLCGGGPPTNG